MSVETAVIAEGIDYEKIYKLPYEKRSKKILLENVSRSFVSKKENHSVFCALKNISFFVREGEFVSIVGPSGCGKSTLINLIAGFLLPESGKIIIDGERVCKPSPDQMVIFQEPSLFPWLTVQKNIEFGLRVTGCSSKTISVHANKWMKKVHLCQFSDRYPHQLSGGMKQRAAIARALALNPKILLMDEPFSSLDHRTRDLLHVELQKIWIETRTTIIFVTHSVEEALRLSDRIIVMGCHPGRVKRIIKVNLPHPRDFFDPIILDLRADIIKDLEQELEIGTIH